MNHSVNDIVRDIHIENIFPPKSFKQMLPINIIFMLSTMLLATFLSSYPLFDIIFATVALTSMMVSSGILWKLTNYRTLVATFGHPDVLKSVGNWILSVIYLVIFFSSGMMWTFWISLIVTVTVPLFCWYEGKRLNVAELY